jgi:peptidyl-prolyl cis-trans isomerase B (cyclophilin B)
LVIIFYLASSLIGSTTGENVKWVFAALVGATASLAGPGPHLAEATTVPETVTCGWRAPDGSGSGVVKDVGTPPATVPATGRHVLTFETGRGRIGVAVDRSAAPCTVASMQHLSSRHFYDGSKCHRLVTEESFKVVQCGDPTATGPGYRDTDGTGGPGYTFPEENLPTGLEPPYPAGTVAMANTGEPASTGGQFFITAVDTVLPPAYTVLGRITEGFRIVEEVVAAGHDGAFDPVPGGGHPNRELLITSTTFS